MSQEELEGLHQELLNINSKRQRRMEELAALVERSDSIRAEMSSTLEECDAIAQTAFQSGGIIPPEQVAVDDSHSSEKARGLDSMAKLMCYTKPFVSITEMADGKCKLCLSSMDERSYPQYQERLEYLSDRTLRYIQDSSIDHISRREILRDTVQNGNEAAKAFIKSFEHSRDRGVAGSVRRIIRDPDRCTIDDIDIVFQAGERQNPRKIFFTEEDIENTKQLLEGKDLSHFIEIADTTSAERSKVHVELNGIGEVIEQNEGLEERQAEIHIGLANFTSKKVGSCAGCSIVQNVIEESRGLTIHRSGDYEENYPNQGYPLPQYLTLEERLEVVKRTDDLFSSRGERHFFGRRERQRRNQQTFTRKRLELHTKREFLEERQSDLVQSQERIGYLNRRVAGYDAQEEATRLKIEEITRQQRQAEASARFTKSMIGMFSEQASSPTSHSVDGGQVQKRPKMQGKEDRQTFKGRK